MTTVNRTKLDLLKNLLGDGEVEPAERRQADESVSEEEEETEFEMAIKLEKEDLESIMSRAMQSAMAARESMAPAQATSSAQGGAADAEVNAISVANPLKIANFWEDDPHTWFLRLEMQFLTRKITLDETKFAHVIQTLDRRQTKEIKAILRNPPKGTSYPAIKAALIQVFDKTQLQKDTELLSMFTLGDRDPRSFIRELRALNEDPETLLRAIVINALPLDVRGALGSMPSTCSHEEIGEQAFKIIDLRKERKAVNAVKCREDPESGDEDEVNAVHRGPPRSTGRGKGQKGQRRPQRGGDDREKDDGVFVCFAHKKFGQQAYTCKSGCSFANLPLAQHGAGNGPAGR